MSRNAAGIVGIIHPEIAVGKEVKVQGVERFLKRFPSESLSLDSISLDKLTSEDGRTERVKSTLRFRGPVLDPDYPEPSTLVMTLLWVSEDEKWWLERPLSLNYVVVSKGRYPTAVQNEVATRFQAAVDVLDKIGLPGSEDLAFIDRPVAGSAEDLFKDMERLHSRERGPKGVDPTAGGVQVLLDAAARKSGGLLQRYYGDFRTNEEDMRRPMPWEMFRDYVTAAIQYGKSLEKKGNRKAAERVYRRILALGRQILDEHGGVQFLVWGIAFQKQAAEELSRILPADGSGKKEAVATFANLASRRLDLLQTALACLDDMTDYKSLSAAMAAATRPADQVFKAWGINTLSILALKGAPANPEATKKAGGMVLVINPEMQATASQALDRLTSGQSSETRNLVERQRQWVKDHTVYGAVLTFR